jgi:hypothetical protein
LNEILVCLLCIVNVVGFEFQIQTLFFFQTKSFDTCIQTQISCIQVYPTKFIVVKTKSRENFEEFLRVFPYGLNPFKIHRRFKFESVPNL